MNGLMWYRLAWYTAAVVITTLDLIALQWGWALSAGLVTVACAWALHDAVKSSIMEASISSGHVSSPERSPERSSERFPERFQERQ